MNENTSKKKEPIVLTICKDKNGIYSVVNKSESQSSIQNGLLLWFNCLIKRFCLLKKNSSCLQTYVTPVKIIATTLAVETNIFYLMFFKLRLS